MLLRILKFLKEEKRMLEYEKRLYCIVTFLSVRLFICESSFLCLFLSFVCLSVCYVFFQFIFLEVDWMRDEHVLLNNQEGGTQLGFYFRFHFHFE